MKKLYKFTCIVCPLGCYIEAEVDGQNVRVRGCRCARGENWAKQEILEPKRVVMSVVRVKNGRYPVVSVKTDAPVPKEKIDDVMCYIANMEISAPVSIGEVLAENMLGLGVNLVATRSVEEK